MSKTHEFKIIVAGIDEAGRGPLAGHVVAAAVALSPKSLHLPIQDSKKLNAKRRLNLFEEIKELALGYSISSIEHDKIDEINILQATKLAMKTAASDLIENLCAKDSHFLVDGNTPFCKNFSIETIIKGDDKIRCIGAASILAKVHRDLHMEKMALEYPQYGFEKHMGYPTKFHKEQIKEFGPCPIHRRTFKGVKEFT